MGKLGMNWLQCVPFKPTTRSDPRLGWYYLSPGQKIQRKNNSAWFLWPKIDLILVSVRAYQLPICYNGAVSKGGYRGNSFSLRRKEKGVKISFIIPAVMESWTRCRRSLCFPPFFFNEKQKEAMQAIICDRVALCCR
jgi:hypothetical protein